MTLPDLGKNTFLEHSFGSANGFSLLISRVFWTLWCIRFGDFYVSNSTSISKILPTRFFQSLDHGSSRSCQIPLPPSPPHDPFFSPSTPSNTPWPLFSSSTPLPLYFPPPTPLPGGVTVWTGTLSPPPGFGYDGRPLRQRRHVTALYCNINNK